MKRPSKQVTSIGVVAVIIGLVAAGISTFSNAGYNPILVFVGFAVLVLIIGFVLDRAAQNALTGRR
jgi:uncharacterized membrane protein